MHRTYGRWCTMGQMPNNSQPTESRSWSLKAGLALIAGVVIIVGALNWLYGDSKPIDCDTHHTGTVYATGEMGLNEAVRKAADNAGVNPDQLRNVADATSQVHEDTLQPRYVSVCFDQSGTQVAIIDGMQVHG